MSSSFDQEILDSSQDHIRKVVNTVKGMVQTIDAWLQGNETLVKEKLDITRKYEQDADGVKDILLRKTAEAETVLHRQDLLRLILKVDEIADYAEGVAVRVSYIRYKPNDYITRQIMELGKAVLSCVTNVREAIFELAKRSKRVYNMCDEIDKGEQVVDDIFRSLEADLFKSFDMDVRIMMQIRSMTYHMEDMGDLAESVSDFIRIIAASR
ncbi:MAG: hypothetical protein RBG13Loki_1114 [Promethearchaeota archaeon CR_4]|nr:MAG: hypothetical protein RBG13Loki_1114 [Candidatus Lokiarchaeota archaeon CR_4]